VSNRSIAVLFGKKEREGGRREGRDDGAGMFGAREALVGSNEGGGGWEIEGVGARAVTLAVSGSSA